MLCRLTGPAAIESPPGAARPVVRDTAALGLDGADLGVPVPHGDSWWLLFGDADLNLRRGALFRQQAPAAWGPVAPNALATFPLAALDGCPASLAWRADPGGVAPVLPREAGEASVVPSGAVSLGDAVYLHVTSVAAWGPACDEPRDACVRYGALARWRPGEARFTRLPSPRWRKPERAQGAAGRHTASGFAQAALVLAPAPDGVPAVYLLGAEPGRRGPLRLAYVPARALEDVRQYRYLAGLPGGVPAWSRSPFDAAPVVPPPVGEASAAWVPRRRRWLLLRYDARANALVASLAPALWGPWSRGARVLDCGPGPWAGCYGGFTYGPWGDAGPRFASRDGRHVYFTVSLWSTYQTYLARLDVDAL